MNQRVNWMSLNRYNKIYNLKWKGNHLKCKKL